MQILLTLQRHKIWLHKRRHMTMARPCDGLNSSTLSSCRRVETTVTTPLRRPLQTRALLRLSSCAAPASVNTGNVYANEFPMTWFENKTPRNSKDDVCCTWTWLRLWLVCWPRRVWRCRWPLETCVCVCVASAKKALLVLHPFIHTHVCSGLLCIVCTFTATCVACSMSREPCRTLNARRSEIRAKPASSV